MRTIRVAINGFGRIGRQVCKALWEKCRHTVEVVAVNDLYGVEANAHLLKYDSVYGRWDAEVSVEGDCLRVGSWSIRNFGERDPRNLLWQPLGVDLVVEATGLFRSGAEAALHRSAGAGKVVVTAPGTGLDLTVVMGVNEAQYDPRTHHVVSNASCTTNCLAPIVHVVHRCFGIVRGMMHTVHPYTSEQSLLDTPHDDLRRARAAACNIVPFPTGAPLALSLVLPELEGRLAGYSLRVPTATVSVLDLCLVLERAATAAALLGALKAESQGRLTGILGYTEAPLVSSDFVGDPHSGVVDAGLTTTQGNLATLVAWYDTEWAYSCRVADLIAYMARKGW